MRAAARIAVNDKPTDEIYVETVLWEYPERCTRELFGALPEGFTLSVSPGGTATIEGGLGVRTSYGCVFEADKMSGDFAKEFGEGRFGGFLTEVFTLIAEEIPGEECPETPLVIWGTGEVVVVPHYGFPYYEELRAEVVS